MKLKLLLSAFLGILLFASCKKDGKNPVFDFDKLTVGSYLKLLSTENVNLNPSDFTTPLTIFVKQVGSPIDKINLYVVDDASSDQTWKLVKTITYSGDSVELSATGAEIAAALGYTSADFILGTTLTFFNQVITKDGKTYDINNAGPDVSAPDYNSSFSWTGYIVCPFTGNVAGNYKVIQDDWADYDAGTILKGAVEDGPGANQITLHVYPNPAYGDVVNPIIVDIDPASGAATVPEVEYGNYGGTSTTASGSGFVFACTGLITLTIDHNYGGTVYGGNQLILQKQ